jgi:hypothetical protein
MVFTMKVYRIERRDGTVKYVAVNPRVDVPSVGTFGEMGSGGWSLDRRYSKAAAWNALETIHEFIAYLSKGGRSILLTPARQKARPYGFNVRYR